MADINRKKQEQLNIPEISSFQVQKDKRGGFNVKINWEYVSDKVIGFRIYKAEISKSMIQRDYKISQRALEKLTPSKTLKNNTQILYTKNYFSENNKVSFFKSDSEKYRKVESIPKGMNYGILTFLRTNPKNKYSFTDRDVQFGNSYSYVLTALTKDYRESSKTIGVLVNVEDLESPTGVQDLKAEEGAGGVLVSFTMDHPNDIDSYQVWRRKVGDKRFFKIFEGRISQKSGALLDETVQAGNEYQYKVYFRDYYGNLSWHSPIVQVEFQSRFLSKGAIADPYVRIREETPYILIEGRRNSPKIIGYRVERQDLWRNEKTFEIKKTNEIPWENVILFDETDKIELKDTTVYPERPYRYRVSSISITGKIESIYVSPPVKLEKGLSIISSGFLYETLFPISVKNFQASLIHRKQDPAYAKLEWDIRGDWDYVKLFINEGDLSEKIIRIDNVNNHIFYGGLKKDSKNKLKLRVFNRDNQFVDSEIIRLNV